jgi:hypothetical protein
VKASARKTPQPSPAPLSEAQTKQQLTGTTQRISALRRDCLIRDRHRCVISRKFDRSEALERFTRDGENAKDDDGQLLKDENERPEHLEVAHILPHSLTSLTTAGGESQLVCYKRICFDSTIHCQLTRPLERFKENRPYDSRYVRSRSDNFD